MWASLFALPTAALAPHCLPAAAALVAAGILFAVRTGHPCRLAGLCALPALLAAIPVRPAATVWPRPGPVRIVGIVDAVTKNPRTDTARVELAGPDRLVVHLDGALEALPGDRITVLGRLAAAAAPDLAPTLHGTARATEVTAGPWSLRRTAAMARQALERQLLDLVPGDSGSMLASLVLGRGTATAPDLAAAHRATGLSHLLAVSGAHAAMLALLLGLRARGHRLGASRARTIVVLLLLAAYAAITGNEPPVLRAVVTFALAAIATRLGRPFGLVPGLAVPAIVTCLVQPDALLSASFLLSYAAVAGLCLAGATDGEGPLRRWLLGPLWSSLWATLLTAPLTLFFFGQLAPWTVLLTPLLAPLVAVLLLGGLFLALLGCIAPALANGLAVPIGRAADLYVVAVQAADRLPATPIHALVVPATWLLVLAAGAGLAAMERWRGRRGVAFAVLCFGTPWFVPLGEDHEPRFVLFAVGHGQAALVVDPSGTQTAIDCGSLHLPALAARRLSAALTRRRLDLLIVTHADQDHHNGVPDLLQRVPITAALLPRSLAGSPLAELLATSGTAVAFLAPGERAAPSPFVHVVVPAVADTASDNDKSAWVRADLGCATVLLTGDAEGPAIAAAITQDLVPRCSALVLPHHGRKNAMVPALLQHTRPTVAFASADAADGDTAQGPVARTFGADVWVTGVDGTIELRGRGIPRITAAAGGRPLRAER